MLPSPALSLLLSSPFLPFDRDSSLDFFLGSLVSFLSRDPFLFRPTEFKNSDDQGHTLQSRHHNKLPIASRASNGSACFSLVVAASGFSCKLSFRAKRKELIALNQYPREGSNEIFRKRKLIDYSWISVMCANSSQHQAFGLYSLTETNQTL